MKTIKILSIEGGGILALALTKPAGEKKIFYSSIWKKTRAINEIIDERYSSNNIEEVLKEYFNDTKLSDALTDVLIPYINRYYRFQVSLKELGKDDLDDASERNGSLFELCDYL